MVKGPKLFKSRNKFQKRRNPFKWKAPKKCHVISITVDNESGNIWQSQVILRKRLTASVSVLQNLVNLEHRYEDHVQTNYGKMATFLPRLMILGESEES